MPGSHEMKVMHCNGRLYLFQMKIGMIIVKLYGFFVIIVI